MRNPLAELIRAHIAAHGPVTFRWFMEQALYHPIHGYYASGEAIIGRRGDFYTNVSVGPLFGDLLTVQFAEMWERLGNPGDFVIVEQGANDGAFARDVLTAVEGDFRKSLRYVIIEPFPALRARQQETLSEQPAVSWLESLEELPPFTGVHFSNELIDAMPVHLVVRRGGQWLERYVDERLEFQDGPASEALRAELNSLPSNLPEGYTTEINPGIRRWVTQVSRKLPRGYLLAIDYGYSHEAFFSRERTAGTLSCYRAHQRSFDPLVDPGEKDITAHVDFSRLATSAEQGGLELAGFTDQHHFLVALSRDVFQEGVPPSPRTARAFQTLMHPEMLGGAFKVVAFAKNAPATPLLRGFGSGRDLRREIQSAKSLQPEAKEGPPQQHQ